MHHSRSFDGPMLVAGQLRLLLLLFTEDLIVLRIVCYEEDEEMKARPPAQRTPAAGSGPTWSFVGVGESKGEREQELFPSGW